MSRPDRRSEQGAITVFVAGLALALLMVAGLAYDGGNVLAERRQAFNVADSAARAGAQAVDRDALRAHNSPQLDPDAAAAAAHAYLERIGHQGTVTVTDQTVEVVVTVEVPLVLLRAVGMETRTVTRTGRATLLRGVTTPEGG